MDKPITPQYQPPRITELGTVAALTQGNEDGAATDNSFPVGTPKPNVTFS